MRRIHPDTPAALRAWLQSSIIILIEVDFIRSMSRGMKMSARVLTAHVPESLAREVDRLAEQLDRPRGWLMKEALARYVELENKRRALTLEAVEDVDAGRVVDHDAIEAWAAKLA